MASRRRHFSRRLSGRRRCRLSRRRAAALACGRIGRFRRGTDARLFGGRFRPRFLVMELLGGWFRPRGFVPVLFAGRLRDRGLVQVLFGGWFRLQFLVLMLFRDWF